MEEYILPSEADLRAFLEVHRRAENVPGIAVALSVRGKTVAASAGVLAGGSSIPLPVGARFAVGCLTKVFTALLTHQLANGGELSLESTLGEVLPELAETQRGTIQRLSDLLSFQSGYEDLTDEPVGQHRFKKFANASQLFRPGCVVSYEHSGYAMMGDVLERVTSTPFDKLVRERIAEPFGVRYGQLRDAPSDIHPTVPDHRWLSEQKAYLPVASPEFRPSAAFSELTMSVEELLCLAHALVPGSAASPNRIPPETMRRLEHALGRVPSPISGTIWKGIPVSFGMGCAHYGSGLYGFDGGSFGQVCGVRYEPVRRVCLAIAISANVPSIRNAILVKVLRQIGVHIDEFPNACRTAYDFDLQHLAGSYHGVNGARLNVSIERPGMIFEFRHSESTSQTARIPVRYDKSGNTIALTGSGEWRRVNLAVFLSPSEAEPSVGCELTAFRKTKPS